MKLTIISFYSKLAILDASVKSSVEKHRNSFQKEDTERIDFAVGSIFEHLEDVDVLESKEKALEIIAVIEPILSDISNLSPDALMYAEGSIYDLYDRLADLMESAIISLAQDKSNDKD